MHELAAHLWWICALASSIVSALFFTANQYLKLPGRTLVFWRGLIPFIVLAPVVFSIQWPVSPVFYGATFITAMIVTYTDAMQLQGASLFGGGVTARMKPFSVWLVFILWFVFHEEQRQIMFSDTPRFVGIICALVVGVLAASNMRKCPVSRDAFMFFLPIILTSAVVDFLNKTAMDHSELWSGIIVYAWIQALIISSISLTRHVVKEDMSLRDIFNRKMVLSGIILGSCVVFMNISKNAAMSFAANPAYVSAIIFTTPFWVSLYFKATGHKEIADVRSGLVFVLSAIVLVLLNSL